MVLSRCEKLDDLLPDLAAYWTAYAALPDWRRRKCDSLRFEADRRRSVAVWLLLRQLMSGRGLEAAELSVSDNGCGKPAFVPPVGWSFSLSHAGGRAMAAISEAEVGCDVELAVPVDDGMLDVALTEAERAWLAGMSGPERDRAFIRLWVRKESYVKAVGRGLEIELSSFSALDAPPSPGWFWRDFDFRDGHFGCVCGRTAAWPDDARAGGNR